MRGKEMIRQTICFLTFQNEQTHTHKGRLTHTKLYPNSIGRYEALLPVLQLALIDSIDFAEQSKLFIKLATVRRSNGESIKFRLFCRPLYKKENNLLGRFGIVFIIELKRTPNVCRRDKDRERTILFIAISYLIRNICENSFGALCEIQWKW